MGKKQVKQVKQDVKSQIMRAAEHEFLTAGYAGARTINIAGNAGVTHAMLHYYFQSKDNLFEMVFQQKAGAFFGSFLTIMEKPLPFFERITLFIETHLQAVAANPGVPLFIITTAAKNPDMLRRSLLKSATENPFMVFFGLFAKEVRKAVRLKIIKPVDPAELLIAIFSLNIFPALAQPVLHIAGIVTEEQYGKLMKQRSRKVVKFITDAIALNN